MLEGKSHHGVHQIYLQVDALGFGILWLLTGCSGDDGVSNNNTGQCETEERCRRQATLVTLTPTGTTLPKAAIIPSRLDGREEIDVYRIELDNLFMIDRPGRLEVKTTGNTDTSGMLFRFNNGEREELASSDDIDVENDPSFCLRIDDEDEDENNDRRNFCLFRELGNGTYFIEVSGFSRFSTGDYTLQVSVLEADDEPNTIAIAQLRPPVAFDSLLPRQLESEGDIDVFHIQLTEERQGRRLTVQTRTPLPPPDPPTDTFGTLLRLNADGEPEEIADDDDGGDDGSFSITESGLSSYPK
ncbi:hypothetical protein C2W62_21025 [Candidatus Entotheonella serta]|nr:hypothetical protein C2W62_21025 [Candidatus Entotheonella serta]